jgi:Fe-S cluster assembly protein SufD
MSIIASLDTFLNEAKKFQPGLDLGSRLQTKELLATKGLPTRKDEAWRNTSLSFLNENSFVPATHLALPIPSLVTDFINSKKIANCDYAVILNGFFSESLSSYSGQGLNISSSANQLKVVKGDDKGVQHLNEIFNLNTIEIVIDKDLLKPLQLINVTHSFGGTALVAAAPQIKLSIKKNREAKVVLSNVGEADVAYLSNGAFKVEVEKDARLEVINHIGQSKKAYHLDYVEISAQDSSTVRYFELNLNAQLTRHEFVLNLNGENIQSEILGVSRLKDSQHCDSQTFINHHKGNCRSEQIYKSLLDDESHSVFCGTVFIAKGLAKADSAQLNQNLLLSDRAEVNSKPVLRIYSDDVKASHGSTMGQIQEDEIFYLQTRCISRSKAVALLGQGFLNEIIFKIGSETLKKYFSEELWH